MRKQTLENKKKASKKNNGITLIALVITIIVLLILAGVSIATLTGDNGILTRASKAQDEQADATVKEAISLAWNEYQIEINNATGEIVENGAKIASITQVRIQGKEEEYLATSSMSFLDFLKQEEKGYIDENGVVNVKALTGETLSKGNGTDGETDVYILTEDEDMYILKYYDSEGIPATEDLWSVNKFDNNIKGDNNYVGLTTTWKVDTANGSITLPLLGDYNVEIDWGDGGNKEKIEGYYDPMIQSTPQIRPNHIYKEPGNYNISVTGKYDGFGAVADGVSYPMGNLDNLIQVLSWGDIPLKSISFANAKDLMYVAEPKTGILKDLVSCNYMFFGCESLKAIPKGTFKDCTNVITFDKTFGKCSLLTSIPEGLFDNCTNVTSFYSTFGYCSSLTSIPEGLFDNCTNVSSFGGTFGYCSSLTSIPEGLFDNCTNVTDFSVTFADCSLLTSIPEGLFDNCTNVTSFNGTFKKCMNVEGEAPNIFTRTNVTYHDSCFYNCTKLSNYNEIPADWKQPW